MARLSTAFKPPPAPFMRAAPFVFVLLPFVAARTRLAGPGSHGRAGAGRILLGLTALCIASPCVPVAAESAADVVNFGADATGLSDSSAAFAAAAATGTTVLVPTGTFHVQHRIALGPGQRLVGMGRTASQITVGPDFAPDDPFVVQLAGTDPGSEIEAIGIVFAQPSNPPSRAGFRTLRQGCTVTPHGTGCKYPWAVGSNAGSVRAKLSGIRISGAWDGVSLAGSGQQASSGFWIDDLEVGALDIGLYVDNDTDFCHIHGYHHWPFGMPGSTSQQPGTVWPGIWSDGQTYAAQLGRCDGMSIVDFVTFQGRVAVAPSGLGMSITNLHLDGNHANLEIAGGDVRLTNAYSTKGAVDDVGAVVTDSAILVKGGSLEASNLSLLSGAASPVVKVTGGSATLTGGTMSATNPGGQALLSTGGRTLMRGFQMAPSAVAYTLPYVQEVCCGLVDIQGNEWTPVQPGGSGVAIAVAVDAAEQTVADNNLGAWGFMPPGSGLLGTYGPNKTPAVAFTPSVTITTPGTFAPTYTTRKGHYWYTATGVEFDLQLTLDANAYTGAGGRVSVTGLPFVLPNPSGVTEYGTVSIPLSGGIAYGKGYTQLGAVLDSPPNGVTLVEMGPGLGDRPAPPGIIAPGAHGITISIHGIVPTN